MIIVALTYDCRGSHHQHYSALLEETRKIEYQKFAATVMVEGVLFVLQSPMGPDTVAMLLM